MLINIFCAFRLGHHAEPQQGFCFELRLWLFALNCSTEIQNALFGFAKQPVSARKRACFANQNRLFYNSLKNKVIQEGGCVTDKSHAIGKWNKTNWIPTNGEQIGSHISFHTKLMWVQRCDILVFKMR